MTPDDLSKARNSDLRASLSALLRAAQSARDIAIQTRTAIVIMRNGRIVRVAADELAQQLNRGAS